MKSYMLILYPKQSYYGEDKSPVKETYNDADEIIEYPIAWKESYWLYEIMEIRQVDGHETKSLYKRVKLDNILIDKP